MKTDKMSRDEMIEYRAGRFNGEMHHKLTPYWQAENERKCKSGMNDDDRPLVAAYWTGYAATAAITPA